MAIAYGNPAEGTEENASDRTWQGKTSGARQASWTSGDCEPPAVPSPSGAALARVIESEVVPRLLLAHQARRPRSSQAQASAARVVFGLADIDRVVMIALNDDAAAVAAHLESFAARGVAVESLYLDLIAPAARRIGQLWEEDVCSFVDVTIALSRLHQVLHRVGLQAGVRAAGPVPRVLLIPAPQEQHTFGLVMLAEFFRRDGWDARADTSVTAAEAVDILESDSFDVVGLTIACEEHVGPMRSLIADIRARSRNSKIAVMAGGRLATDRPALLAELDIDAAARDGAEAVSLARTLVKSRGETAAAAGSDLSR